MQTLKTLLSPRSAAPGEPDAPVPADAPYHRLNELPRGTWLLSSVAAVGTAEQRLRTAQAWMQALLQGQLPDSADDFGDAQACTHLRDICGELMLPALCRKAPALAEQVLRTVLWHLDSLIDRPHGSSRDEAVAAMADSFRLSWRRETRGLDEEFSLLLGLGNFAQLSWGSLRGALRSRPWEEAQRAAQRLADLPALSQLIRQLGRTHRSSDAELSPTANPQAHSPSRAPLRPLQTVLLGAPGEITGIAPSAHIERMLPSEAVMLRHPVLRKLWRARYAEGRLLSWQTQALLTDWRVDPQHRSPPTRTDAQPSRSDRGPIILCLDTSGSMQGAPERIAKAVVIAALQAAHAEHRACRLIAFGGPGELIEHDLHEGDAGLQTLLGVMAQSFDGGTDVQTPIERAIATVHEAKWRQADLLIVSDGEFGCVPQTLARLDEARQALGLRVHGILVGDRETMGLLEVCDHIHWEREWRRFAQDNQRLDSKRFSPVHSKSLTALYFPNALSARAAKHHPPAST